MRHSTFFLVAFFISFLACNTSNNNGPLSENEKHIITKEINKTFDEWLVIGDEGIEKHFLDMMYLTDHFVMISDNEFIIGGETMPQYMKAVVEHVDKITDATTPKRVINVLSKNHAVITFQFDEKVTAKSGETFDSKGNAQYVLEKINGKWKVISMMATHQR